MVLDTNQPFTRSEALAAGITVRQLAGPGYQRLFHAVYLRGGRRITALDRARGALKISPAGSYVSHHTAGLLWGGWVPDCCDTHVAVPDGTTRSQRRGIWAHRADPTLTPVRRRGVLVTPPARVFLELAQVRVNLVDLVAFGDSLVRADHVTRDGLRAVTASWAGKGAKQARLAATLVREGVDSAPESRLRMLMVLAGLPEPEVNLIVRTADGEWRRRFDLCYPALKIILEYDGQHHRTNSVQWNSDILRREQLEREGWTLIVITSQALFREPAETLTRIRTVLDERGMTGLPPRTAAAWHRHFPGRADRAVG